MPTYSNHTGYFSWVSEGDGPLWSTQYESVCFGSSAAIVDGISQTFSGTVIPGDLASTIVVEVGGRILASLEVPPGKTKRRKSFSLPAVGTITTGEEVSCYVIGSPRPLPDLVTVTRVTRAAYQKWENWVIGGEIPVWFRGVGMEVVMFAKANSNVTIQGEVSFWDKDTGTYRIKNPEIVGDFSKANAWHMRPYPVEFEGRTANLLDGCLSYEYQEEVPEPEPEPQITPSEPRKRRRIMM